MTMKLLNRVFGLLMFSVTVTMGVALFGMSTTESLWAIFVKFVAVNRPSAVLAGVALLCLALLVVVTASRRKRRPRFLSFDREGGTVSISTEAISEYVAKLVVEFPSVVKMKTTIVSLKSAIDIVVDIKIKAGPQIHEVCELVQKRVRESVGEDLGIAEIRRVEVSVTEIVSEHRPR